MEQVEIAKSDGNFFYTGTFEELEDDWVFMRTIKGEEVYFRREQVMQRKIVPDQKIPIHNSIHTKIKKEEES